jgi:predicted XRE-type DNA-binding protein
MKTRYFENVWDAIEPTPAAANMKAKSTLMFAIQKTVEDRHDTQSVAAKRLGLPQPRLNDLLRGRINKFSLDILLNIADRAGLSVVRPPNHAGFAPSVRHDRHASKHFSNCNQPHEHPYFGIGRAAMGLGALIAGGVASQRLRMTTAATSPEGFRRLQVYFPAGTADCSNVIHLSRRARFTPRSPLPTCERE